MADPRMNSLHLDPVRRQDYRRAREVLLNSCGQQTLFAQADPDSSLAASATCIRNRDHQGDPPANYWLADREFIYPLKVGVNTLGRSSDNDIVVEDAFVSRRHCAILVHHDHACELHETASKNGVYLNGARLTGPTILRPGDQIRICDREFIFQSRSHGPEDDGTHTQAD